MPQAPSNKKAIAISIVVILILIALALLGLNAAGLLRFGSNAPENKSLQATHTPPPPTLAAQTEKPPEMPQEVYDWLEHLRLTEEKKEQLKARQIAQLSAFAQLLQTLGPAIGAMQDDGTLVPENDFGGPEEATKKEIDDLRPAWREVQAFFQSKPAPDEVKGIAQAYDEALYEITGMAGDTVDLMDKIQKDPQAALQEAMSMQYKSYERIDKNLLETDELVKVICEKYGVRKWFDIHSDLNGGSLGKFNVSPPLR